MEKSGSQIFKTQDFPLINDHELTFMVIVEPLHYGSEQPDSERSKFPLPSSLEVNEVSKRGDE